MELTTVWDGNEVWLLVAGGATVAAFPLWYATMFSGMYLALFLVLVGLILRGIAFEYRGKRDSAVWRARWDMAMAIGSALPALLFGVAFGNIVSGMAIEPLAGTDPANAGNFNFTGNLLSLLNPFSIVLGLMTLTVFMTHGAVAAALWLSALAMTQRGRDGWAFLLSAGTILLAVAPLFIGLFPNVMPSTVSDAYNLTVTNASSQSYTLTVMTIVAVVMTPIFLVYQSWTFWVFRKRISTT